MGETYGSVWTAMVYMVLVFTFISFIILAVTIVDFWSGKRKLEDGFREGDYAVVETLSHRFHPCKDESGEILMGEEIINKQCTGLRKIDESTGEITYQIYFQGKGLTVDATSEEKYFTTSLSY